MDEGAHHNQDPKRPFEPRSVSPRPTPAPEPDAGPLAADRVTERVHAIAKEMDLLLGSALGFVSSAQQRINTGDVLGSLEQEICSELAGVQRSLDQMAHLMRDVMSPLRLNPPPEHHEHLPLAEAVLHAVESQRAFAHSQGVELHVEFSPRLVLVQAGPIFTAIVNALRNAIEAASEGGRVDLIAEMLTDDDETSPPTVQIDVFDDGPGPPRDAGDRVFDPCFSTKRPGPGLGLALAREIVTELGGTIQLQPRTSDNARRAKGGAHLMIRFCAHAG